MGKRGKKGKKRGTLPDRTKMANKNLKNTPTMENWPDFPFLGYFWILAIFPHFRSGQNFHVFPIFSIFVVQPVFHCVPGIANRPPNFRNTKFKFVGRILPFVSAWLPADINYFGINYGITVTDSLPTLVVWELITDNRYRLRIPGNLFSQLLVGLPSVTVFFSELISVTVIRLPIPTFLFCWELDR